LRYPGGKGSLSDFVRKVVVQNDLVDGDYVEPFAGGAGVAWSMLLGEYVRNVHINDLDRAIHSFWSSTLDHTDELCRMIRDTRVNMTQWRKQKAISDSPDEHSALDLGFSTFFLNRTNRSGIIKGGVIGGKEQSGPWKLNARFNKHDLIHRIERIARYKSRISLYCMDGREFIEQIVPNLPQKTLIYLDPPYYAKGKELYENHLSHNDHENIAALIQGRIRKPWIVSYDAVPEIRAMYTKSRSLSYCLSYSVQARYRGQEIMFFSDGLVIPQVAHPISPRRRARYNGSISPPTN
jgi:DNA adenine methylase